MTTRKSKNKGNSHRNGRTKRGGFLAKLFDKSFSWFGNKSETPENPESTEPAPSKEKFDWSFGLIDKLQPPSIPEIKPGPIIPGRPPMQQPQMQQPQMQQPPMQQQPQMQQQQQQPPMQQQTLVTAATQVQGGRRLRVRTKKRKFK